MTRTFVPTCEDMASDEIVDHFDDMINPPGLTNHWATAQVDHDVVGVRSVNVPPISQGDSISGQLYLQGRLARSYGQPVATRWRPDRVERTTTIDGWLIKTTTVCPPGEPGVVVHMEITNTSEEDQELNVGLWMFSTVTNQETPWLSAEPPQAENTLTRDGAMVVGTDGSAFAAQQFVLTEGFTLIEGTPRLVEATRNVARGQTVQLGYVHALAVSREEALGVANRMANELWEAAAKSEAQWNKEIAAIFEAGNDEFSGSMPILETDNEALLKLYWWGVVGVLWFRRDNPASVLGRTYDTLMPRYWQTTTFIWDYSLSSHVHAQLDPAVMRRQIAHWVGLDIDKHFGTEWLTGGPVGYWYSVNHYAMTRLVRDYISFTGDVEFLDEELTTADGGTQTLADHLLTWSRAWHRIRTESGLADYGEVDNLLECVSSYIHEVASLNAANVWCMRTVAELIEGRGRADEAAQLRQEAQELVELVKDLYVPGKGFFHTRQPDGSLVETRHCYDFATVGELIAEDLDPQVRAEMVHFFETELQTPSWMRALSPYDQDAGFSLRSDHQWNGAYPAWPADAARSAIALGSPEVVAQWLPGLARTANQGPPGQAHFVEEAEDPINGGARKTPPQYPYLIDWSCSSAGAWVELVISAIVGVKVDWDGQVEVAGCLEEVDPTAVLRGLSVRGKLYDVSHGQITERSVSAT